MKRKKRKRLYNICCEILGYIERGNLTEEQIYRLEDELSFYKCKKKMPITYIKLLDTIEQKWWYRQINDLSPEQLFIYGWLYGCMQAMEMKRKRRK